MALFKDSQKTEMEWKIRCWSQACWMFSLYLFSRVNNAKAISLVTYLTAVCNWRSKFSLLSCLLLEGLFIPLIQKWSRPTIFPNNTRLSFQLKQGPCWYLCQTKDISLPFTNVSEIFGYLILADPKIYRGVFYFPPQLLGGKSHFNYPIPPSLASIWHLLVVTFTYDLGSP